jgi:hypothetical protein
MLHAKSPVCADTFHVLDGFREVAANVPVPVVDTGAAIGINTIEDPATVGVRTLAESVVPAASVVSATG